MTTYTIAMPSILGYLIYTTMVWFSTSSFLGIHI